MIAILLSIICSSTLVLLFRWFYGYRLNTFQVIVANYWVCVICATLNLGVFPLDAKAMNSGWLPYALFLGLCFVSGFYLTARTVETAGVAIASIMQKMSLVLVVSYTVLRYAEPMTTLKILGVLSSILAIFFSAFGGQKNASEKHSNQVWLPVMTLILAGVVDIMTYDVQKNYNEVSSDVRFTGIAFGSAGFTGAIILGISVLIGKQKLSYKSLLAGILLGIPNFFSIVFLFQALGMGWGGSVIFPIINVGIISFSTLVAWKLFHEKMTLNKLLSIFFSLLAIVLIAKS